MRACVRRGTGEIGGNYVEVEQDLTATVSGTDGLVVLAGLAAVR
jgi:hypothetical protein